jgi:predicted transcriptional regulator
MDQNQELAQQMEELRQAMQGLDAATIDADKGLTAFGKATGQGVKDLGVGLGSLAKDVGKGDTSFKSLNKVVDVAADALGGMAKTVPFAGQAVAAGIKAAAEAAKFMLDQMDQTTKAFNDLGNVGALTADGMTGLQRQFTQSGLSLKGFTKLVGDNSVALARFKGIAGDGAEVFSKAIGDLTQGNDDSLRRIGMNSDQIGETVGAFVTQQTRLGRSQTMTSAQLAVGAREYGLELDRLSKLTGISREALQKEQDATLSDSRFRANYDELVASGGEERAKALMNLKIRFGKFDKEMGQGIADLASGSANTEAARRILNSTGGAAQDVIARLRAGEIDEKQANIEIVEALERNKSAQLQNAKYIDASSSAYSKYSGVSDAIAAKNKDADQLAKEAQDKQLSGSDDLTKKTTEAQKNIERMNIEVNKLGFTFLPKAASATASVTNAMKEMVKYVNKIIGKTEEPAAAHGGSKATTYQSGGGAEGVAVTGEVDLSGGGAAAPSKGSYLDKMIAAESGGKNIANRSGAGGAATSSAYGLAQITKPTFEGLVKKAGQGNPLFGKTFDDMKADVNLQIEAAKQLTDANRMMLESAKVSTSDAALYLAHFMGPSGAIKALKAGDTAPIETVFSAAAIEANPSLKKMTTVADLKAWADSKMGNVGYAAAEGAILSGPMGGYSPNLTMHGTEAIVPIDTPATNSGSGMGGLNPEMFAKQLEKLEELASVFKNQLAIDQKILQYSS